MPEDYTFATFMSEPGTQAVLVYLAITLGVPLMLMRIAHFLLNVILVAVAAVALFPAAFLSLILLAFTGVVAAHSITSLIGSLHRRPRIGRR